MDERADYIHRICELTHKLEVRANVCRGLYPVFKAADFLRISLDRLPLPDLLKEEDVVTLETGKLEELCSWLETMLHHPETSLQMNALSLIRRGEGTPFRAAPSDTALEGGL